ncbi:unnamed protein product, partial [Closterium sp. NIES-53]
SPNSCPMNCLCLETFLLLRIRLLLLRLSPNLSPSLCLSLPSPSLPRFLEIQNLEPGSGTGWWVVAVAAAVEAPAAVDFAVQLAALAAEPLEVPVPAS